MFTASEVRPRTETPTFCFSVHAESDPSVLPRVTGVLAKRGLVPERMIATRFQHARLGAEEMHVDFQVEGLDHTTAELLANEMRRMVMARVVLISEK